MTRTFYWFDKRRVQPIQKPQGDWKRYYDVTTWDLLCWDDLFQVRQYWRTR